MKMPADVIREEIRQHGVISFARFMAHALYCPETGYYERNQDNVSRAGDFITSVSTGEIFGQLLAYQFGGWLENLRPQKIGNEKLKIIEAGAHDGKLAADILNWLQQNRAELFSEIEYIILEPSITRQRWQRERLKEFANVSWQTSFNLVGRDSGESKFKKITGIIFSNELLDAFPVHRYGWDAIEKKWFEWGVALDGDNFCWAKIQRTENRSQPSSLPPLPSSLLEVLPNNYTIETSPDAEGWWGDAAKNLAHGKLLAIDYGFTAEEQFSPARLNGTLRAYHRHRVTDDLLLHPGEQDLTAHVNFSAIQNCGEAAGLKTETYATQPQFLTRIFGEAVKEKYFTPLTPKQIRQFQTLTHPDHLGRAFKVLVQSRYPLAETLRDWSEARWTRSRPAASLVL
jgi:SAM-dependent MidA family methyltransferase